ncbi:MAG: DegV family protein [Firmicutes bacterium]|nr:DegV family protein [Bacillota bacterium]
MSDFIIFTDAASDLPTELIETHGISVLPMYFEIDGRSYRHYPDGRELGYSRFYQILRSGIMAKTSLVNSLEYLNYFEPVLKRGLDILYISLSSGLSGTYQSSVIAAKELMERYPERKVYCIDSRCASVGQGMLVYHAALKKYEGLDIDELKDWVVQNRDHLCHWFTVNDLNYLKRGGRLSTSAAIVGTMLSVKPILHVDKDGHLILRGKVRGRRKSLVELAEHMEKFCVRPEKQTIFIGHGDCIDDTGILASIIKQRFALKDVAISYVGPIIGAHTGPEVMVLCFFGSEK